MVDDTRGTLTPPPCRGRPSIRLDAWLRGGRGGERVRRTTNAALGDWNAYSLLHLGGPFDVGRGLTFDASIYNRPNTDFPEHATHQGTPTRANPGGVRYTDVCNIHQEGRRLRVSAGVAFPAGRRAVLNIHQPR